MAEQRVLSLDALEALASAATPGPWAYEGVSEKSNDYRVGVVCAVDADFNVGPPINGNVKHHPHYFNSGTNEFGEWYCEEIAILDETSHSSDGGCGSDAAFIAASREAVPELITALRASQAENARLTAENDKWEAAAKATDIYPYLQEALARMGTVGPKGIREMVAYCAGLQAENARLREARRIVDEQASDYRLWFISETITEDTLQNALRRLHAAIEGVSPDDAARAALAQGPET